MRQAVRLVADTGCGSHEKGCSPSFRGRKLVPEKYVTPTGTHSFAEVLQHAALLFLVNCEPHISFRAQATLLIATLFCRARRVQINRRIF